MQTTSFYTSRFSQAELDKQYSPSQWARQMSPHDRIMAHVGTLAKATADAKANLACELAVPFDSKDKTYTVHYFNPTNVDASTPIVVYIHGGYWTAGVLEDDAGGVAGPVVAAGATLATLQYRLSPPNRIAEIIRSVREAIAFLAKTNPGRPLYIAGHSAGGQLGAMVLATDWKEFGLRPEQVQIRGALLISGIFDLMPIKLSCVNQESSLDLTPQEVEECSPFNHITAIKAASDRADMDQFVLVAVGEHDAPDFVRQSKEFEEALRKAGVASRYFEVGGADHFDAMEGLADSNSLLTVSLRGLLRVPLGPRNKELLPCGKAALWAGAAAVAAFAWLYVSKRR